MFELPSTTANKQGERIEYAIVEFAAAREEATMSELVEVTKRSRPTVLKRVRDLIERGILAPTQTRNSPYQTYRLNRG